MANKEKDIKKLEEKIQKDLVLEEEWDKTKIAVGIILVIVFLTVGILGKNYLLGLVGITPPTKSVQGAQIINLPGQFDKASPALPHYSIPSANDVQSKISEIQKQVSDINIADLASSSPQIQSVIEQIQALPQLPASIAKQQCLQICQKL